MKYRIAALMSALLMIVGASTASADQVRADGDSLTAGLQSGNPSSVSLAPGSSHTFKIAAHIIENGNDHVSFPVGVEITSSGSILGTPSPASGNVTAYDTAGQLAVEVTATAPASSALSCGTNNLTGKVIFTATTDTTELGAKGTNAEVVLSINVEGPSCSGPVEGPTDTTPPTMTGPSIEGDEGDNGWYTSDVTATWTCSDDSGVVADTVSGTTSGEGTDLEASATCEDLAGNTTPGSASFDVDKTAPDAPAFTGGPDAASYFWGSVPGAPTGCTSDDATSGVASCAVTGYGTSIGNHTMTATATDTAGHTSSTTHSYSVLAWTLGGYYRPVDMDGILNTVKAGSTVPLKFNVWAGDELTSTSAILSHGAKEVSCTSLSTDTDPLEYTATGSTSLRYDTTGGQFIYNWQTPKKAGSCWVATVVTLDGSKIKANFKLK